MTLDQAVRIVLFQKYADFNGRARRSEYWWWFLASIILGIITNVIQAISYPVGLTLSIVIGLALLLPNLAVNTRRLHDTDRTGWWILLVLIPIVGWIILLVWLCQDSEPRTIKYGPSPKPGTATRPSTGLQASAVRGRACATSPRRG